MDGLDGNFNLGGAGQLAVGGLIGEGGVAGTGLLANTGDLNNSPQALSETLIFAGEAIGHTTGGAYYVADIVDGALPGSTPLAGTVIGVLDATGQTLVQSGEGNVYLLDGLTAAPGDLITASIGGATALGSSDAESLLGLSVLSGTQQQGSLLTVGAASGGEVVTLGVGGETLIGGEGALGVIPTSAPGGEGGPLGGIEETVDEILDPDSDGGLLGGVEDTVGGIVNHGGDDDDHHGGLLGGLLGDN
ncbi:MAG: hypothetical protein DHS20C04_13520 [Hyphococcus sp.]|nr:MAG: hypothetical protein DHS20C04_13520 [Marinicaulis sp.]